MIAANSNTTVAEGWLHGPPARSRARAHQAKKPPSQRSRSSAIGMAGLRPQTYTVFHCPGEQRVLETPHGRHTRVKQLIAYLLENMILDFQGNLTLEMVREFLRDDDSRESRLLLSKLVEDRGVSDMMITLADCLQDVLRNSITDDVIREQIRTYAES